MGKKSSMAFVLASAISMTTPAVACEETHSSPEGKPCDETGAITIGAAYTADIWRGEGGAEEGWRYLDNFDLTLEADLEKAIGWKGATGRVYVLYNNGASLAELTGDAQVVSNIETGVKAVRLYEAWISQSIGEDASLKIGLYDLNSEFDALEAASLFMGSAHGIGTDIAQSGENGPSIFPSAGLSARLSVDVTDTLTIRVAVLDGVPGNPNRPSRTSVSLNEGALLIGETDWKIGKARILVGAWGYTDRQESLIGDGSNSSRGVYLRGESCVVSGLDCDVAIFARAGIASGDVNPFNLFLSSGIMVSPSKDWDFGLAVAHANASQSGIVSEVVESSETVFEVTAAHAVTDWLTVQPNIQYVVDPAGTDLDRDALALGIRIAFEF